MNRKKEIKIDPLWKLVYIKNGKKFYYLNLETKEVVHPENAAARFASNSSEDRLEMPSRSSGCDSNEMMDWEVATTLIKEIRNDPAAVSNVEIKDFSTIGVGQVDYRRTRSGLMVVFDTCALIRSPTLIRRSGKAKIPMRIPYTVLQELERLKKNETLRTTVNGIHRDLMTTFNTSSLLSYENSADFTTEAIPFEVTNNDDKILKTVLMLREHVKDPSITILFVTNDLNLSTKAMAHGVLVINDDTYLKEHVDKVMEMRKQIKYEPEIITIEDSDSTAIYMSTSSKKKKRQPEKKIEDRMDLTPIPPLISPPIPPLIPSLIPPLIQPPLHQKRTHSPFVDHPIAQKKAAISQPGAPRTSKDLPVNSQKYVNPANPITSWNYPEKISVFTFKNELDKFLYIFRVSVEKALYLLTKPTGIPGIKGLLFELCNVTYLFIKNENKSLEELNEFLDLLEVLYERVIRRLNSHQKIVKDALAAELSSDGEEGEAIKAMMDFCDKIANELGWLPPTTHFSC